MSADDSHADTPVQLVAELMAVVPRLVDRTRSQAEFARAAASLLPCVGPLLARRHDEPPPGVPEHERVDVLSVLADDGRDLSDTDLSDTQGSDAPGPSDTQESDTRPPDAASAGEGAPAESELPIQDYDSLAASQVVPRLATLTHDDLRAVQAYESATRHRQTILHRVAQLLAD